MNKLLSNYRLLLVLYGCVVMVIGSFFLVRDSSLMHLMHNKLPLLFRIRFSVFWLMCLVIAVSGYLLYLSYNQLHMPEPDKVYAARLGRIALYVGVTGSSLALLCFLSLRHYPFL